MFLHLMFLLYIVISMHIDQWNTVRLIIFAGQLEYSAISKKHHQYAHIFDYLLL